MFRLLLGAVCIGFAPIFVKLIHLGPSPIGLYRCGLAAVFLFAWIFANGKRTFSDFQFANRIWRLLFLGGALFALDLFVWHRSVMYAGAGLGTILGNTQVFYVALIGIFFYKERPNIKFFLTILLAFLGIYLLVDVRSGGTVGEHYFLGVLYGLCTGVVYACYILVMRRIESLNKSIPTEQALAFVSLFCSLTLLIVSFVEGDLVWPRPLDWLWLISLALVSQVLGWLLITRALPKTPVSRAGLILNAQPVVAVVAGELILGEHLSFIQMAGAVLTLIAIYLGTRTRALTTS